MTAAGTPTAVVFGGKRVIRNVLVPRLEGEPEVGCGDTAQPTS